MHRAARFVSQWEWLILLLLIPLLMFSSGWLYLLLLVIPFLWIVRRIGTGHFISPTPYDVLLVIILLMVLVSLYATFDITLSIPKIAGVVLGIALFYTAVAATREHDHGIWYLVGFILLAGTGMAAVGFLGVRWPGPLAPLNDLLASLPGLFRTIPGAIGGVINPNELAGVMCWIIPLLAALVFGLGRDLWHGKKLLLLLLLGMLAFTTVILLGSQSRGGIGAVLGAFFIMLAVSKRWGRILLVAALLAVVFLFFYFGLDTLLTDSSSASDAIGIDGRLEIWSRALYGLADFPFTGMSMNGFRRVVHILYPLFLVAPDTDLGHAHNQLLQAGLDLGIPGLISYLGIWLLSAALLYKSWQPLKSHPQHALVIGISGALAAGWLFGLLDAIALGARPGFIWWLLLAVAVALFDQAVRLNQSNSPA